MIEVPSRWWDKGSPEVFLENVRRILPARGTIVDFGAGRGKYEGKGRMGELIDMRAPGREVVGIDVDDAVLENRIVDRAAVWDGKSALPLADASVDAIVSLAVFEHVEDHFFVARELARVLKPGGWLCAWTPNKWGYVAIAARIVPNALHVSVLKYVMPHRQSIDTFPTFYRMNTKRRIAGLFPDFGNWTYVHSGPPSYTRNIAFFNALAKAWETVLTGRTLHIFLQKSAA